MEGLATNPSTKNTNSGDITRKKAPKELIPRADSKAPAIISTMVPGPRIDDTKRPP